MRLTHLTAVVALAFATLSTGWAQDREELLASPKIAEGARTPEFVVLTPDQVVEQVSVNSGRNYAWFGFNTPEIHVVLPSVDNSVYASVDFADPKLFDSDGAEVPYERERGLYDHDTHHDELRFMPVEGETPVEYARAVGTATVCYPLRIQTLVARKGEPPVAGLDVSFDGPYVSLRTEGDDEALETASFTGIEAFRALDASGRQLEAYPSTKMSMVDGLVTETKTYWGEVVEVQTDVVDEWTTIRVTYDLPSVPKLPEERAGSAPADGNENPPTPGAEIDVQVVVETPGMAVARELGVTPDEAVQRLRELRFPQPSGDYMVMSAVQGNMEALKLFLAAGYPIDFAVADGRTALNSAVMYGHTDVAAYLIGAGADVNLADANNATPLFNAATNCDAAELVRALIDAGADPSPATRGGMTALQMAEVMGCGENRELIEAATTD
jgi:hypothetical protein